MSQVGVNRFQQVDPRLLQKSAKFGASAQQQGGGATAQGLKRMQESGAGVQAQFQQAQLQFQGGVQRPETSQGIQGIQSGQGRPQLPPTALAKFGEDGPNQIGAFAKLAQNMNPNAPQAGGAAVGKGVQLPYLFA